VRFRFHNPVQVHLGRGLLKDLSGFVEPPALVICGRTALARTGLETQLGSHRGLHSFSEVEPNPSPDTVARALDRACALGVRTLIGLGGGSAMDVAKCVAAIADSAPDLARFVALRHAGRPLRRSRQLIQIPTTAGTGSEVTRWASLWDERGQKRSFDDPLAYADRALIDPELSEAMSPRLTAATGLDAVAHAMESLWGLHANPVSDLYALRALELAAAHLRSAVRHPSRADRDAMALAALLAGLALSNCRSAGAHALSYELTGRFGLEHGLAVGLGCKALLPWNARHAPDRVALVLRGLGVADVGAAQRFIDEVFEAADLEARLAAWGVGRDALEALAAAALGAERLANNPGPLDRAALRDALEAIA
jgi:alcohol dehydrogenase class IV